MLHPSCSCRESSRQGEPPAPSAGHTRPRPQGKPTPGDVSGSDACLSRAGHPCCPWSRRESHRASTQVPLPPVLPQPRPSPCPCRGQCHRRSSARGRRSSVREAQSSAAPPQSWAFSWGTRADKVSACVLPGWHGASAPLAFGRESRGCRSHGAQPGGRRAEGWSEETQKPTTT